MPFAFPFEPLLNMKKNLEELSHMRLFKNIQQLRVQEEEIQGVIGEILRIEQVLREKLGEGVTASEYMLYKIFEEDRSSALDLIKERKKKTVEAIEAEQENLIQLSKERKMFERLKAKQLKRYLYYAEKLEQKMNEEMVITRYPSFPNSSKKDSQSSIRTQSKRQAWM